MRALALFLVAACHGSSTPPTPLVDGSAVSGDAGTGYTSLESYPLGLNDVSMLFEVPVQGLVNPTIAHMTGVPGIMGDLVPRDAFAQIVGTDSRYAYERYDLISLRFDLCDRAMPGSCPLDADGQLRLVFEVVLGDTGTPTADSLQASYPIPAAELGPVVDELRALARLRGFQTDSPLAIDDFVLSTSPWSEYRTRLRALIARYASAARLQRLAFLAPTGTDGYVQRALVRAGAGFVPLVIPTLGVAEQRTSIGDDPEVTYDPDPVANAPVDIVLALQSAPFDAAPAGAKLAAMRALALVQNPELEAFGTEQCASCHAAGPVTVVRAATLMIDPATIPDTYASTHPLSTMFGIPAGDDRFRMFSWNVISQRVVNETAQVLDEIAQRFPPATTPPPDAGIADAPPVVKRVFITSTLSAPQFGGVAGADQVCAAAAASLGGQWDAWLSTSTVDAIAHVAGTGPWYLVDRRTLVFPDHAALASAPLVPIDLDELGAEPAPAAGVWTGTGAGGTAAAATCNDWTADDTYVNGMVGDRAATDGRWTESEVVPCIAANQARLYCFER